MTKREAEVIIIEDDEIIAVETPKFTPFSSRPPKSPKSSPPETIEIEDDETPVKEEKKELEIQDKNLDEEKQEKPLPSYYMRNWFTILNSVLQEHEQLFLAEEKNLIKKFQELSEPAQRLYIRLFQRKVILCNVSISKGPLV
jgi:hypothetical protein